MKTISTLAVVAGLSLTACAQSAVEVTRSAETHIVAVAEPAEASAPAEPRPKAVLRPIDYADAGSTALAFAVMDGAVSELNPLASIAGEGGVPFVGLGVKYGIKKVMIHRGSTQCEADRKVGIGSVAGLGNNLAVLAGATGGTGLAVGIVAAMIYASEKKCTVTVAVPT